MRQMYGYGPGCRMTLADTVKRVELLALVLLAMLALPQSQALADLPAGSFVLDGEVKAVVRGDDQSTYVGGTFTQALGPTGSGIVVSANGSGAPDSSNFPHVAGEVREAISDQEGGWYIGGNFNAVGGLPRHGLAHVLADGSVDASWNPTPDYYGHGGDEGIYALALTGSTLYVGGSFSEIGQQARFGLAAIDTDTGEATPWDPDPAINVFGTSSKVMDLAISDSILYVGGVFHEIAGAEREGLAAFNTTTGELTAWNPEPDWGSETYHPNIGIHTILVDSSTVYVGGGFDEIGSEVRSNLAALDGATGEATTWAPNPNFNVYALAKSGSTVYVGGDGGSVVNGDQGLIGGEERTGLAAVDATTGNATNWNPDPEGVFRREVLNLKVSGSTVYAGGEFDEIGGAGRGGVAALDVTTGEATSWNPNPGGAGYVQAIDGRSQRVQTLALAGPNLYIGGDFAGAGPPLATIAGVARVTPNGSLDASWPAWQPPAAAEMVTALAVASDTIYVGGHSLTSFDADVTALDASTGAPKATQPNLDALNGVYLVQSLAATPSTVYVGASFNTISDHLAAFNATTGGLESWDSGVDSSVQVMQLSDSASTLYVGGSFDEVRGELRNGLAAIETATGDLTAWNPEPDSGSYIESLALSGSTMYVGGKFDEIGGQMSRCFAAVSTNTGEGLGWSPEPWGGSCGPATLAAGNSAVYVGGNFNEIGANGGVPRSNLAAVDPISADALDWNPGGALHFFNEVNALLATDSTVYVGGNFRSLGEQVTGSFAQLNASGVVTASTLEIAKGGTGGGTVTSVPAGISCGPVCSGEFTTGDTVVLTAVSAAGSTFTGWSGGGCSGTGSCEIVLNGDTQVTATFVADDSDGDDTPETAADDDQLSSPSSSDAQSLPALSVTRGIAFVARFGQVKGNNALIRTRCAGDTRCRGVARLIARMGRVNKGGRSRREARRARNVAIGKGRFNIAPRKVSVLRVRLTHSGRKLLHRSGRRGLRVRLVGRGLKNRMVKLKPHESKKRKRSKQAKAQASSRRTQASGGQAYINSVYANKPIRPTSFSPNIICPLTADDSGCNSFTNYVRDIQWTSWGGRTAEGTGRVSLLHEDGSTSPVTVWLGGLKHCAGFRAYTTYRLTVAPGTSQPKGWPTGRTGKFPCDVSLAGGYHGQRLGRYSNCIDGLYQPTANDDYYGGARWRPRPPNGSWRLCELRFKTWGKNKAIGTGTVYRASEVRGRDEWPIRIELSRPVWCPRAGSWGAITYGTLEIRLKGRQLRNAGRTRRYVQRVKPTLALCVFDNPESDIYGNPLAAFSAADDRSVPTDSLSNSCVKAGLAKPRVLEAWVRHPGDRKTQSLFVEADWRALPDDCDGHFMRVPSVRFQLQSPRNHARWINLGPYVQPTYSYTVSREIEQELEAEKEAEGKSCWRPIPGGERWNCRDTSKLTNNGGVATAYAPKSPGPWPDPLARYDRYRYRCTPGPGITHARALVRNVIRSQATNKVAARRVYKVPVKVKRYPAPPFPDHPKRGALKGPC